MQIDSTVDMIVDSATRLFAAAGQKLVMQVMPAETVANVIWQTMQTQLFEQLLERGMDFDAASNLSTTTMGKARKQYEAQQTKLAGTIVQGNA